MRRLLCPLLLACLGTAYASEPTMVSLRIEYYAVEKEELNALLAGAGASTDATKLRKQVRSLLPAESAELIDSAYIAARTGQRATVESVVVWPYATTYAGPGLPQDISGPVDGSNRLATPVASTQKRTVDLGLAFEAEALLAPGGEIIELNLSPELVTRTGDNQLSQSHSQVIQPTLHNIKTQTAITLRSGTWANLGVHSPPETYPAAGTREVIALLRASALKPGNEETEKISAQRHAEYEKFGNIGDPFGTESGQPPPDQPGWYTRRHQIATIVEWFETDASTATALLDRHASPYSDATALRSKLLNLAAGKKASLVDYAYVTTRPGQRAKGASVAEIPEPTGIHPPQSPGKLSGSIDPSVRTTTRATLKPTEFRDVGPAVEIDPITGNDKLTIAIGIDPELVQHAATTTVGHGDASFSNPVFFSFNPQTHILAHDGVPVLLAMGSPAPADPATANFGSDKRLLLLLTARLITSDR